MVLPHSKTLSVFIITEILIFPSFFYFFQIFSKFKNSTFPWLEKLPSFFKVFKVLWGPCTLHRRHQPSLLNGTLDAGSKFLRILEWATDTVSNWGLAPSRDCHVFCVSRKHGWQNYNKIITRGFWNTCLEINQVWLHFLG